ncbi:PAS domain-containing sensor histidine kinase [Hymenobacter convexus]|uniref:PAS domain-containing sensor histidine kinase n=1 Tax=Hymenobacter sp. CA1UV-4 TaxID=3063782 RepID=UPI002712B411|nr:PAS domain S-box protein [Hymenobacter sp. CA1UV-4]MDO7851745.1 PAS domain S-box protein [Hymenobacter sp. CA1UV-4]
MYPSDSSAPDPSLPLGPHEALLALRARAEQRRHLVTQASEQHSPEEVEQLVQELQVHQIELEMQYEELLLAQAEATTARAQYIDLYDFAPVGYCTLNAVGTIEQLNLCASRQLGTVRQRLVGRRFALFVAPPDRLDFGQFLARVLSTDATLSTQLTLQREDGSPFYAQLEGLRAAGPDGHQCRLAVVDVTARRQAADALAASEARFRKLFNDSNDAVVLLQGHQFVDCNAAAVRLLGCRSKADVVGHPAWAHAPEVQPSGQRTIDLFRETTSDALRTGSRRCEALMHKATGEEIWMEAVLTPIELGGNTPLVHILWRDITQVRAAREELRQSQERFQLALDASESGVWVWEIAGHELHWDARAQAIFGLPHHPEPVSFEVLHRAVHSQDLPAVAEALRRALTQQAPFDLEHRIVWPDGRVRYVAAQGKVASDAAGQPQRLIGIMRDVTPRREAEDALRREKEFSESLLENTVDGILAIDRAQRVTAWNAEAARYFGQEAAAVLGRPLFDVMPFLDEQAHANVARALAGDHISRTHQPFHSRPGYFDVFLIPLKDDGQDLPSGVLVIVRDVTERDRLAEEATQLRLRQQQEVLAAILATQEAERKRIAEALHNGLGQVLYATKLSLEHPASNAVSHRETLKLLDEAIRSTRTISFELTPGVLEDFGLRTALETLVKRIAPTGLPVGLHLRGLERRLSAPVEIAVYRVVQELLNNVMKHAHAAEVEVHVARENGRLYVSVEDNGQGFDPATLATQPLAGIGLSGVRNRVALLGGEVAIASRLGRGTIVSFELNV